MNPWPKKKGKKPQAKRRSQRSYCDTLWSLFIRGRANGRCQRCNRTGTRLEAAHIIPRRVFTTRWHPGNGIALCAATCHRDFDNPASELVRLGLIRDWIGEKAYADLLALARQRWDKDYDRVRAELKMLMEKAA